MNARILRLNALHDAVKTCPSDHVGRRTSPEQCNFQTQIDRILDIAIAQESQLCGRVGGQTGSGWVVDGAMAPPLGAFDPRCGSFDVCGLMRFDEV